MYSGALSLKCYTYHVRRNQWIPAADLYTATFHAGHDSHPEWGFVIHGGSCKSSNSGLVVNTESFGS